jgi:hypothetical protein
LVLATQVITIRLGSGEEHYYLEKGKAGVEEKAWEN